MLETGEGGEADAATHLLSNRVGGDQSELDTDDANVNIPLSKVPQGEHVIDEEEVEEQEQEMRVLRRSNRYIKPPTRIGQPP